MLKLKLQMVNSYNAPTYAIWAVTGQETASTKACTAAVELLMDQQAIFDQEYPSTGNHRFKSCRGALVTCRHARRQQSPRLPLTESEKHIAKVVAARKKLRPQAAAKALLWL